MRFINYSEVPCDLTDVRLFGTGELVGADDDLGAVKWVQIPCSNLLVEGLGLQNHRGQEEFVRKLLMPLLAKAGGYDDENLPFALSPSLGQENPSLNRLSQPNF